MTHVDGSAGHVVSRRMMFHPLLKFVKSDMQCKSLINIKVSYIAHFVNKYLVFNAIFVKFVNWNILKSRITLKGQVYRKTSS